LSTQYIIAIEAVGSGALNRLYLFASGAAPSWDSNNAWQYALKDSFPGEIGGSVSFRDGTCTIGGISVELIRTATAAARLYEQRRTKIAELAAIQGNSAVTITLSVTTLSNTTIVVGREVQRLGAHSGGGVYPTTRARLATRQEAHGIGAQDNITIYNADYVPYLKDRRLFLYRCNMATATAYGDLELLYTGIVRGVGAPTPEVIRVDADSLWTLPDRVRFYRRRWVGVASPGASSLTPPRTMINSNTTDLISPSPALISLDGKCLLTLPYTTAGGVFVASASANDLYATSAPEVPEKATGAFEVLHCTGEEGDDTAAVLSGNLLTLWLQALTTTDEGNNGVYDLGIKGFGLGVPQGNVDIAGVELVRASLGDALLWQPRLFVGLDNEPEKFLDYFRPRLLAYGLAGVATASTIKIIALKDNGSSITAALVEGVDIVGPAQFVEVEPPSQARRFDLAFDRVQAPFALLPGAGSITDTFIDRKAQHANVYGDSSNEEINCEGLTDRALVSDLAIGLIHRFHHEIPEVSLKALRTRSDVELGDLVLITHSKVYKGTGGTLSVSNALMLVVERSLDLSTNLISLRLLYVGALYDKAGAIAPAAVVDSYDPASPAVVVVEQTAAGGGFASGLIDTAPRDTALILAGYKLDLCTSEGVVRDAGLEVASVTNTSITFTTTPSPAPVAGNVIRFSSFDTCTTAQQENFAWLADATPTLGAGGVAAFEYTGM
jgi:hypothetical protein